MGRVRRDAGIAAGGLEALLGQRRIVVGVDQVMRHAGMIGMGLKQRFENFRRPHLVGIGPIGWIEIGRGHQRMQDRGFHVIGIVGRDLTQRLLECLHAGAMVERVAILYEGLQRLDVALLALARKAR
jgi:hypothetical protein